MNSRDEELQNDLQNGHIPKGDALDVKAYQDVFRALQKDPGFEVSPRFAEKVASRVAAQGRANQSRDYFWFGAGIFFLLLSAVATVLFIGFKLDFGFLNVMADYKGLAIFGILFIVFLNWLDKRLVRDSQVHY